ncbi:Uncharacterized protein APZ42_005143, partial [Daphnia magna]
PPQKKERDSVQKFIIQKNKNIKLKSKIKKIYIFLPGITGLRIFQAANLFSLPHFNLFETIATKNHRLSFKGVWMAIR